MGDRQEKKSCDTIKRMMLFYPLVCTLVFFLPVTLGVLGNLSFPGLSGKEADRILPLMVSHLCGDFMGTLIMSAGLAALMSTMDSQLLTLSSIFTRDIYPFFARQKADSAVPGKIFVLVLASLGFFFAINPPSTMIQIATQTFTGLAVLFPTVLFGLYSSKPDPLPAAISIILGEVLVGISYFGLLPSGDFLPAIPIIIGTFLAYIGISLIKSSGSLLVAVPPKRTLIFALLFSLILILAVDWWQWSASASGPGGFPLWMGYFILLSLLQTFLMGWWLKNLPNKTVAFPGDAGELMDENHNSLT
jgi:SSS family solute:Na+ symporter